MIPIFCEDFVIKFIEKTGLNDMRIRYHECPEARIMKVERSEDQVLLHFMRYANTSNTQLLTLKTISWNFARVSEYYCEKVHEPQPFWLTVGSPEELQYAQSLGGTIEDMYRTKGIRLSMSDVQAEKNADYLSKHKSGGQ